MARNQKRNKQTVCVGCQFIKQFTPHEGGWCRVHGDIPPVVPPSLDKEREEIIKKLGGDKLELENVNRGKSWD